MKTWIVEKHGVPDGLTLIERLIPDPGEREVLVRIHAVSLNYRDLLALRAHRPGHLPPPFVPCSDGAGTVVRCGLGADRWKEGDRVAGIFFPGWFDGPFQLAYHKAALGGSVEGLLSEYALFHEDALVAIPAHLSWAEAAALPCAGVTAWHALFTRGALRAGHSVLVLGTGGVSIFALQLAKAAGATVFITSSSDQKLARASTLGASHGINYRNKPDWDREIWALSGKRGVDHVIEVGGGGTLGKSIACVAPGGQIALIGVLTGFAPASIDLFPLLARNARIDGIYVGSRSIFEDLNRFIAEHRIQPIIDRIFPFDRARDAFEHLESAQHFGKVAIDCTPA